MRDCVSLLTIYFNGRGGSCGELSIDRFLLSKSTPRFRAFSAYLFIVLCNFFFSLFFSFLLVYWFSSKLFISCFNCSNCLTSLLCRGGFSYVGDEIDTSTVLDNVSVTPDETDESTSDARVIESLSLLGLSFSSVFGDDGKVECNVLVFELNVLVFATVAIAVAGSNFLELVSFGLLEVVSGAGDEAGWLPDGGGTGGVVGAFVVDNGGGGGGGGAL